MEVQDFLKWIPRDKPFSSLTGEKGNVKLKLSNAS